LFKVSQASQADFEKIVAELVTMIKHSKETVRLATVTLVTKLFSEVLGTVYALASMPEEVKPVVVALIDAMTEQNPQVRAAVLAALGKVVRWAPSQIVTAMVDYGLRDRHPEI